MQGNVKHFFYECKLNLIYAVFFQSGDKYSEFLDDINGCDDWRESFINEIDSRWEDAKARNKYVNNCSNMYLQHFAYFIIIEEFFAKYLFSLQEKTRNLLW